MLSKSTITSHILFFRHETRYVQMGHKCTIYFDAGPALKQHWLNVCVFWELGSRVFGDSAVNTWRWSYVVIILANRLRRWPTLKQHCLNVSPFRWFGVRTGHVTNWGQVVPMAGCVTTSDQCRDNVRDVVLALIRCWRESSQPWIDTPTRESRGHGHSHHSSRKTCPSHCEASRSSAVTEM